MKTRRKSKRISEVMPAETERKNCIVGLVRPTKKNIGRPMPNIGVNIVKCLYSTMLWYAVHILSNAGDSHPQSLKNHEANEKHKANVARFLNNKRKDKLNKEHEDRELMNQLRAIESVRRSCILLTGFDRRYF